MKKRKRAYVQTARRELQEQTRLRIVEALVELHEELGPKYTTITAVAKRAGVQRLTVYRHFENESAMFRACSSHWAMQNPAPRESDWQGIDDPDNRVLAALFAVNHYFLQNTGMLEKLYRDAGEMEAVALVLQGFDEHFTGIADKLVLDLANGKPNKKPRSLARLLVRFSTWQSLSRENLKEAEIARIGLACLKALVD